MEPWKRELLTQIPSMHKILEDLKKNSEIPHPLLHRACEEVLHGIREEILSTEEEISHLPLQEEVLLERILLRGESMYSSLTRVINGTGILLHTNLGRAPLSREAIERMASLGGNYMNLEYNIHRGKRGTRYEHLRDLLSLLTKAQDSLVVNNNAAAVLLILDTFASKKEVIVSRGELIEIGGSFRLPDVMKKAGVKLVEVGTTNRTSLGDFKEAIGEETALIMKSHQSNYKIMGFTEEVSLDELVSLSRECHLPFYYDMGSGNLLPFSREPTVREVVTKGVPLISFSGDKLLGGPQAGIIVGDRDGIEALKKNPLTRALRVGKLTLLTLEETLRHYVAEETEKIPLYQSLNTSLKVLEERGRYIVAEMESREDLKIEVVNGEGEMGGGSLPLEKIESRQLHITSHHLSARELKERLLAQRPPIIGRIVEETLILDLLAVNEEEIHEMIEGLKRL